MANTDFPKGFRAITNQHGTVPQTHEYLATASTNIYAGSPVALAAAGTAEIYTALLATANNFVGVAVHGRKTADTVRTILVYDDPKQEYEAQMHAKGVTTIAGCVGANFSLTGGTGGNATLMQSTAEIEDSTASVVTVNATLVHPVKVIRLASDSQNSRTDSWVRVICKFNDKVHVYGSEDGGIA